MLVIDAYNVLHTPNMLPPDLAGLDVPGLIRLIAVSRYGRRELTLVCDGGRGASTSGVRMGHARVLFSGTHHEADDLIEQLIRGAGRGASLAVVSSDKRLRRAARKSRAEAIESDRFLAQLVADRDAPPRQRLPAFVHEVPLDRYSVAHWMREFGLDADTPPAAASPAEGTETSGPRADPAPQPRADRFGERLVIPSVPTEQAVPIVAPDRPQSPAEPAAETGLPERVSPHRAPADIDPLIRQALEEWRGRLSADDLDTGRWIDGVTPLRRGREG